MNKAWHLILLGICLILIFCYVIGCDQFITRNFGGEITINLPKNEKLVEATWKGNNLWYLTEPMDSCYVPKTKMFKENSIGGLLEGKVIFVEHK